LRVQHLPDFFILLARQGVRCGSYVRGEGAGRDGTAPTSSTDALFGEMETVSRQRGCTGKVISIVVAAAIAKDGEVLASLSEARYRPGDLATEGEERA